MPICKVNVPFSRFYFRWFSFSSPSISRLKIWLSIRKIDDLPCHDDETIHNSAFFPNFHSLAFTLCTAFFSVVSTLLGLEHFKSRILYHFKCPHVRSWKKNCREPKCQWFLPSRFWIYHWQNVFDRIFSRCLFWSPTTTRQSFFNSIFLDLFGVYHFWNSVYDEIIESKVVSVPLWSPNIL